MRLFTAVAVASSLLVIQAFAESSSNVQDFATKVAISDMFEVQTGNLAAKRGNAEVKSFGQKMVKDHTKTTNELKKLATKAKVKLPAKMDDEHQKKLADLQKTKGDEFNTTYARMQVEAHQTAVQLFESYSKNGDNAEVKAWAAQTLPDLQKHLEHAKSLK